MSALVLAAASTAACGSSAHDGVAGSGRTTTTVTTHTTGGGSAHLTGPTVDDIEHSSQVTVGGKTVAVPTESGTQAIGPSIDDGQQIIISVGGFLPARLFSAPNEAVTWTNLTDQPQQVIFDFLPVKSPVIPPGGTFSWTSQASQSIAYRSASGLKGVDTVNPPFS